jgi:hypothetical protein
MTAAENAGVSETVHTTVFIALLLGGNRMAERPTCSNGWGKAKIKYRTRAAAEKAARRSPSGIALHVYVCKQCRGWHLTSEAQRHKTEQPPSAAKLRRILRDRAAQIAAQQRRLEAAEAAQKKAEENARRAVTAAADERAYIEREVARLFGSKP